MALICDIIMICHIHTTENTHGLLRSEIMLRTYAAPWKFGGAYVLLPDPVATTLVRSLWKDKCSHGRAQRTTNTKVAILEAASRREPSRLGVGP